MPAVAATANADDHLWAQAAYRKSHLLNGEEVGWGADWSLFRSATKATEDRLPMPNLYPSDKTGGLDVYYVGMVWARALWDIRQILGRALTDSTLLSVYPALIGWAIDFETAAENLIDSFRRNPTVSAAQVRQVLEVFSNRNVISGRSVQAVAQTVDAAGAVTCYAGTPKELLRSGDGGVSWQSVALPAPAQVGRGGVALAALGPDLYAATGERVYHFGGAAWTLLDNGWPAQQFPLCLRSVDGALWAGSTSGILEFVPNGAPSVGVWQDRSGGVAFSVIAAAGFVTPAPLPAGGNHPGMALIGLDRSESLGYFSLRAQPAWNLLRVISQNQTNGWMLCLETAGNLLYAGTLAHGLWRQPFTHNGAALRRGQWEKVVEAQIDAGLSVLALAFHRETLFVGTTTGLFGLQWDAQNPATAPVWQEIPLDSGNGPTAAPLIRSVRATDSHLLVGTGQHGVWVRARNGGNWRNQTIDF